MSDLESTAESFGFVIGMLIGGGLLLAVPLAFVFCLVMAIRRKTAGWKAAAIVCGLLCLIPLGLFSYGIYTGISNARQFAAADQDIPESREIVSDDGLCALTLPEHWQRLDNVHDEASLQIGNLRREEYLIMLTDLKEDFEGTLEQHVAITSQGIMSSLDRAEISEPESLTINGLPAVRFEISGTLELTNLFYIQTTFEGTHGFHQMLGWTLASKAGTARDVLLEVAETFHEAGPVALPHDQT